MGLLLSRIKPWTEHSGLPCYHPTLHHHLQSLWCEICARSRAPMYRLLFLALLTFVPHHGDGAVIEARKWSNQGVSGVSPDVRTINEPSELLAVRRHKRRARMHAQRARLAERGKQRHVPLELMDALQQRHGKALLPPSQSCVDFSFRGDNMAFLVFS